MIEIKVSGTEMTVKIKGEVDHHHAEGLRNEIDSSVRKHYPETLILDFGGVTFCDSSGIALVMGRYKLMKNLGGEVELENLPRFVETIFRMANIEKLIKIRRAAI